MKITLKKATMADCEKIHKLQISSFKHLLDKYHDTATNPGAEPLETIVRKMNQNSTDYYFIQLDHKEIGSIRIVRLEGNICRISPMFILPEFQGNGFAQQAITAVETLYPKTITWQLDTIKEEKKLCHLYEKTSYIPTGKEEIIQDNMTIIYYEKSPSFHNI